MNKKKFFITSLIFLAVAAQTAFARDNLDKWLDKYEEFVETVEEAAKNKQTSKIDSLKEEQKKLIAEKKRDSKTRRQFYFFSRNSLRCNQFKMGNRNRKP